MLLDTDVLIDLERQHPAADAWLSSLSVVPHTPRFAAMELLNGCQSRAEWRSVEQFLRPFPICWPAEADLNRALRDFTGYRLSHGLGLVDALIAATALGRGEPLATFNVRHYQAVSGLVTVQPYTR
jgi:predicted nucleic acid-binding protein